MTTGGYGRTPLHSTDEKKFDVGLKRQETTSSDHCYMMSVNRSLKVDEDNPDLVLTPNGTTDWKLNPNTECRIILQKLIVGTGTGGGIITFKQDSVDRGCEEDGVIEAPQNNSNSFLQNSRPAVSLALDPFQKSKQLLDELCNIFDQSELNCDTCYKYIHELTEHILTIHEQRNHCQFSVTKNVEEELVIGKKIKLKNHGHERGYDSANSSGLISYTVENPMDEDKPYKCLICGNCYSSERSLVRHRKAHTGQEKPWFLCNVCPKKFRSKHYLRDHSRLHTGNTHISCCVCGRNFASVFSLTRHKTQHMAVKPFKCEVCGRCFGVLDQLTRHKLVHSGNKRFKCEICGSGFNEMFYLNRHKSVHTGQKRFKCELCGLGCHDMYRLNRHKLTHTGQKKSFKFETRGEGFTDFSGGSDITPLRMATTTLNIATSPPFSNPVDMFPVIQRNIKVEPIQEDGSGSVDPLSIV